jgi:methyl acetate hydrolase
MIHRPSRRDILRTSTKLVAAAGLGAGHAASAPAKSRPAPRAKSLSELDALLLKATDAEEVPGIVALAATENGILYEGVFGARRLDDRPAMTRDTIFRIASMVKLITTVAALQLVERGKLSLDAPVPDIDPAVGAPQVLDGFDSAGLPELRPAKRPILLRHLLTHTSGFTYRLWDEKAVEYFKAVDRQPAADRSRYPHEPLMFDPGDHWQYGVSIDWVGRIVERISGEELAVYLRKHILDPLKMNDTTFVISPKQRRREAGLHRRAADGSLTPEPAEKPPPKHESFSGGGGIYSTGPDYLTFIRMLLRGGSLDGVRILRPETVALMGQNQIGEINVGVLHTTASKVSNDVDFFPDMPRKWGFGHLINTQAVPDGRSAGSLTWGGIFNTYYWIDPEKHIAAVFLAQVLPFADNRVLRIYRAFERGIYRTVKAN